MSSAELQDVSPNLDTNTSMVLLESEPPSTVPKPLLKPISGGVLNGTAVSLPSPGYPDTARKMRASGMVTVDVVIDEEGKVISAKASAGPTILREAAVTALLPDNAFWAASESVGRHQLQIFTSVVHHGLCFQPLVPTRYSPVRSYIPWH